MIKTFTKDNLRRVSEKLDYNTILELFEKYEINTINRIAGFLAQVMHESADLKYKEENLSYSDKGLKITFGKYYKDDELAKKHAYKPQLIGSRVYANRMGNGSEESRDGYRYRGRGYIQLTGKDNYTAFARDNNMSIDETIEYLTTDKGAMESALWYWDSRDINKYCDNDDISAMSKAVNGGMNGYEDRKHRYNQYKAIFGGKF